MTKYDQSIIYKICCNDPLITDIYVGSTTNFKHRKYSHKNCCINENNNKYNSNVYQFIRTNGGWDNWSMIEVEKCNAVDKRDLEKRERYWLETLKATLNKQIPTRTRKEWGKEYYIDNKEKIKEYRENNKENLKKYEKEYFVNNKESIKKKHKLYRQDNKEKINKNFICECGGKYQHQSKSRHIKSKKHQDYMKNII